MGHKNDSALEVFIISPKFRRDASMGHISTVFLPTSGAATPYALHNYIFYFSSKLRNQLFFILFFLRFYTPLPSPPPPTQGL